MSSRITSSVWNIGLLTLAVLTVVVFATTRHPRTDELVLFHFRVTRLFLGTALLTILVGMNAVRFLVVFRDRTVGVLLALLTGISVFFLVEAYLKR